MSYVRLLLDWYRFSRRVWSALADSRSFFVIAVGRYGEDGVRTWGLLRSGRAEKRAIEASMLEGSVAEALKRLAS